MLSIGNEELKKMKKITKKVKKINHFHVIHTNIDKSTEICKVIPGLLDGVKTWKLGFYKTSSGNTIIAVVDDKILPHVKIFKK